MTALAVSAYLVATFLPCEAPAGIGFRPSGVASNSRSAPHAESMAVVASGTPQTHDHAGHAMRAKGHRPTTMQHADQVAGTRKFEPPQPAQAHSDDRSTSHPVFKAPCTCGCGDTRSTVGGGASRLGPAVVETSPAPFIGLAAIRAPDMFPARVSSPTRVIDPIPI